MAKQAATSSKPVPPEEERRGTLDYHAKEEMLAVLIRNVEAFEAVAELFTPKEAKTISDGAALIWRLTRKFYATYSELPGRSQLTTQIHQAMSDNPDLIDRDEQADIDKFLDYAWNDEEHGKDISTSRSFCRAAIDTCRQLMEEVVTDRMQVEMVKEGTLPVDLPHLLEATQSTLNQVKALTEVDVAVAFPDGWDVREEAKLIPTNVPPLDEFTGGGLRGSEVLLFMAPYGSCKTTTCCHAVSESLEKLAEEYVTGVGKKDKKGRPMIPMITLIFTEGDLDEYRCRILSHMARVPWNRLTGMTDLSVLDDGTEPGQTPETKYEEAEFAADSAQGAPWLNEVQRVKRAVKLANRHLLLVDCTNSKDNPYKLGAGGMEQIASVMQGIFRKRKNCYPTTFWVDHVAGIIDRLSETILDENVLRRRLGTIPLVARDQLATPFAAPVILMHQLSGAANEKGAAARFHHTDAEGCKSIAKYAVFAVQSGPVDNNNMCVWACTKHRRQPPSVSRIVHVIGNFNRLVDRTDTHGIAPNGRAIMSKQEMQAKTVKKKNQPAGPSEAETVAQEGM